MVDRFDFLHSYNEKTLKESFLNEKDAMDNQSVELEIDHRITPYRYNGIEPVMPENPTDEYLKKNYMLLTKKNNNIKREACKKCIDTNVRQTSLIGIKFFYSGNERFEGTCEGCWWAYPEKWKEEVGRKLNS
jgi:hypothetical protein